MIDANDLAMMREAQGVTMHDICVPLTRIDGARDAYNRPQELYLPGLPTACGLDMRASKEVQQETRLPLYDARLRLPVGTDVTHLDRIKVTHRYGEALTTALYYDVIGEPLRGPSGLLLNLRTATTKTVEANE